MTTVDAVFLSCAGDFDSPSSMFKVQRVLVKNVILRCHFRKRVLIG
jgi:hypothetical protein